MHLTERTVFSSELLEVRHAVARPSKPGCSDLAHAQDDLLLLPVNGVFAFHEAPRRHVVVNSNHGLFLRQGQPYRMSFPGWLGDQCLVLRFSPTVLDRILVDAAGVDRLGSPRLRSHCLLAPATMLDRSVLRRTLAQAATNTLAIEETAVALLDASARAAREDGDDGRPGLARIRRREQVEAVKEAISLNPAHDWSLGELARLANASPYHLARVFNEEVGLPVHRYLVRTRLAKALEEMQSTRRGLTDIALDAGFSHHSHFTSSFRAHFGLAPAEARRRLLR